MLHLVRFAPVVVNAVAAVLVAVIGRVTGSTRRQALVGSMVVVVANWIGQDYFAPQAMGFLLHLTVIALVLTVFGSDPARRRSDAFTRRVRPRRVARLHVDRRTEIITYLTVLVIVCAVVVSHQLTPVFLAVALLGLAVMGRIRTTALPFVVIALYLGWLSLSAEAYWLGHLDNIVGSVGEVSSLLGQNVSDRAESTSGARQVVVRTRIAMAILVWVLALWSILRERRRGRTPTALVCLFVAPFPLLLVQPYGGEMILRVTLFALPPAALLIARLAVPASGPATIRRAGLGVALVAAVPLFVLARFGNERFEHVGDDDVRLAEAVEEMVPDESFVYVRNRQSLVNASRVGEIRYRDVGNLPPDEVVAQLSGVDGPVFVMLTESQAAYGEVSEGFPEGWLEDFEDGLVATGRFAEVVRFDEAVLYRLLPTAHGGEEGP